MTIVQGILIGFCFSLFVLLFFLIIECLCKYLFENTKTANYLVIYSSIAGIVLGALLAL